MIEADKYFLESRAHHLTIEIRQKELSMFLANMRTLATQSTFMTGIAFSMLYVVIITLRIITMTADPDACNRQVHDTKLSESIWHRA